MATIDADLSHDPTVLATMYVRLTDVAQSRIDCVIGSRYIAGGRIIDWPWHRRLASRLVNAVARFWLGLPTRDNSSALRMYRVEFLRAVDVHSVRSRGFAYLEEILWRIKRSGGTIAEIPIEFRDRTQGQSKLRWLDALISVRDLAIIPFSASTPSELKPTENRQSLD